MTSTRTSVQGAKQPGAGFVDLAEDFASCERLARSHYENFTVASFLLPRAVRRHLHAVYAFCRHTDDLGDEAEGDRLQLLDAWEAELRRCYGGEPQHPVLRALQHTIATYRIPAEPFLRLIEANRMDQRVHRFPTYADLLYYCEHSANPVGRMVLHVLGYEDPQRQRLSDATCTALQLANFWQDAARDLDRGRIYIPLEDMVRFGYSEQELLARVANDRFRALMYFQVERTRAFFRQGWRLADLVRGRLRIDLRLFTLGGWAVLDAIERQGFDTLSRRPALSRRKKASLFLAALLPVGRGGLA